MCLHICVYNWGNFGFAKRDAVRTVARVRVWRTFLSVTFSVAFSLLSAHLCFIPRVSHSRVSATWPRGSTGTFLETRKKWKLHLSAVCLHLHISICLYFKTMLIFTLSFALYQPIRHFLSLSLARAQRFSFDDRSNLVALILLSARECTVVQRALEKRINHRHNLRSNVSTRSCRPDAYEDVIFRKTTGHGSRSITVDLRSRRVSEEARRAIGFLLARDIRALMRIQGKIHDVS